MTNKDLIILVNETIKSTGVTKTHIAKQLGFIDIITKLNIL